MKVNKPYKVNTENCMSHFETLQEAINDFTKWNLFYTENKGYGSRKITVQKGKKIIFENQISE